MFEKANLGKEQVFIWFVEINCGKPLDGTNTYLVPDDLVLYSLDTYTYSCKEGYTTDDEMCTVCLPDGTLSLETLPNCSSTLVQIYRF